MIFLYLYPKIVINKDKFAIRWRKYWKTRLCQD